jgi:hypothetical protein
MKQFFVLILAVPFLLQACDFHGERIRGNGSVKTDNRNTGTFHSIDVSGAIDVYVKQDSITSVRVETDENLHTYIRTEADGTVLRIFTDRDVNLDATGDIKVYVTGPAFSHLEVSGASHIYGENKITGTGKIGIRATGASGIKMEINVPSIDADITGASSLTLRGETREFEADASGASQIRCFELMSENADVDVSGASGAEVFASVKLDAGASGASNVRYKGNAAVTQQSSGASDVRKAD